MNVLSLFDGISCGQVALERAGIEINNYFSSEVDKYAIKVTQNNYPNTIQIGDIKKVSYKDGILYTENGNYNVGKIDLIIGGSPCQGFSYSGKRLNFEDPRSKLFFEFERLIEEINPKYFLLENVRMKKESQDIITERLKVEPIEINSSLLSAQNRRRLYWTNIEGIEQPEDKSLVLKDILQDGNVDRDKSYCIDANYYKGGNLEQYFNKGRRQLVFNFKDYDITEKIRNKEFKKNYLQWDSSGKGYNSQHDRAFYENTKHGTLPASNGSHCKVFQNKKDNFTVRKLTPIECERLQTLPDNYTDCISNSQRYKSIGNGWTVDVISHIFSYIK